MFDKKVLQYWRWCSIHDNLVLMFHILTLKKKIITDYRKSKEITTLHYNYKSNDSRAGPTMCVTRRDGRSHSRIISGLFRLLHKEQSSCGTEHIYYMINKHCLLYV